MQRREWVSAFGGMAATMVFGLPAAVQAQGNAPREDTDYIKLDRRVPVEAPVGKIEVVEFFWYSCPHCSAFEPALAAWVKKLPKDVAFRRVPVAFQDNYVPQQKLFYTLEAMGLVDKLHARVFAAIHDERQSLVSADAITAWVVKQGVDKAAFLAQFNSFSVSTKASRAKQLTDAYLLEGVPALGVAGRFFTDGARAKSMDRALSITDFLVSEVRSGR